MSEGTNNPSGPTQIPPEFVLTDEERAPQPAVADNSDQNLGWQVVRELLETVVLALVIFLVIRQGVQNYRIESHSMEPNFSENQFVLVNKLAYRFGEPHRGDVLVFHNPNNPAEDYIKRIVGLPGDTLTFRDGDIYVNGDQLVEPFISQPTWGPDADVVVGPEALFVMGDNRNNSRDSRAFGQLSEDLIVGKAWLRVWPFSKFGLVQHQGDEVIAAPRDE